MALTSAQRVELIQKMYVAYYGRPADTGGLDNWVNHLARNNDDASAIIQAFGTSPEATSLYGEPVNYALAVNALYMQMFNRPAEPDGLALYVAHLNAGRVTLPNLALAIATGAQNADRDTFLNKVEVATAFTAEVATSTENILGYAGEDAAAHAAAFLAAVTAADASVTAALANLKSTIDTINGLDQLSSLPTHMLTTGLDNLLGTNGNDVVLVNLTDGPNGERVTLEQDDAFNALLGRDTLRLDAWGTNVNEWNEYQFELLFETISAAEDAVNAAQQALVGLTDPAEIAAANLVLVNALSAYRSAADGYASFMELVDTYSLEFNSADYDFAGFERVLVQARNNESFSLEMDLAAMPGVDLEVRNMGGGYSYLSASNIGGDALVTNFDGQEIDISNVAGDVSLRSIELDNNFNASTVDYVGGSVSLTDVITNGDVYIYEVGGDVTVTDSVIGYDGYDADLIIDGVGGNVTITDTTIDYDLEIINIEGNTVTFNNVEIMDSEGTVDIEFADTVTSATVNLNGLSVDDWMDVDGVAMTNLTFNVTADSDINELHLHHDNIALSQVTINLTNADLDIDYFMLATPDEDGNAIPSTLTINGTGNLYIGDIDYDGNEYNPSNFVDIVYTGSGSIDIGSNGTWEPHNGSFNASTATGAVTIELDLNEAEALDFTYVGSRGADRVVIEGDSLGNAAADEDTVRLSLAGGAGIDTLVLEFDDNDLVDGDLSAAAMALVSGFEVLELDLSDANSNETIDLTHTHSDFTSIVLADGSGDDISLINLSATQAQNISILASDENCNVIEDLTIALKNATGLEDRVALTLVSDANANNNFIGSTIYMDDIEHLTINTAGDVYWLDGNDNANLDNPITSYIEDINANELQTLTINGAVSLDIDAVYSDDLRQIDARSFTGAFLGIGSGEGVWTEDDLVIFGAANSDHDMNIFAWEDVTVTTGNGNDDIEVYAGEDVVINAGNGNNNVYVDSFEGEMDSVTVTTGTGNDDIYVADGHDVTITSGAGDDTVYIDYAYGDVTVSMGDGDDNFNYTHDGIHGDLVVDAGAGDDVVTIKLDSDDNLDSATVTLGAGSDELYLSDTRTTALNDFVVTVTDFAVAGDVLFLDESADFGEGATFVTVSTRDGDYDVTDGTDAEDVAVIEFTFNADNNSVAFDMTSDGSDLLEALGDDGDTAVITVAEDQSGYIIAYNGGNAYIFNFQDVSGTNPNATVNDYDSGFNDDTGEEFDDREDFDVYLVSGTEGFAAGDYITFNDLLDSDGDFVYTISAGETGVDTLGANIASAINALANSRFNASYNSATDELYFTSYENGNFTDVSVVYTNVANTGTIDSGEIELVAVLQNVAVGSLSTANIDFYNWSI